MNKILLVVLIIIVVALAGVLVWQNWGKAEPIVNNQPPITDETANWKTYTNKENEFEIKYPKKWFVQAEDGCTNLCGCKVRLESQNFPIESCGVNGGEMFGCWPNKTPSGAIFDINTSCTPDDLAYKNFVDSMSSRETFKLGGVIATIGDDSIIYSYPNTTFAPDQTYNFFHNGLQYTIRTMIYVKPGASELEAEALGNNSLPIFEQMLSTFKFVK